MKSKLLKVFAFWLLCFAVVIPNSAQVATTVLLITSAVIALLVFRPIKFIPDQMRLYFLSAAVTTVYILVGQINNAPFEAARQIAATYIIGPALWIVVSGAIFTKIPTDTLKRWFVLFTFFAVMSIAIYFFLYLTRGADAVTFFIAESNLDLSDDGIGATMYVYGSMIFLSAGLFAAPQVVRSLPLRAFLLSAVAIAAFTSGRSAFIISIPFGLLVGSFFGVDEDFGGGTRSRFRRYMSSPIVYMAVASLVCLIVAAYIGIDLKQMMLNLFDKITSGGGEERASQSKEFIRAWLENFGFGAGQGIGISIVRSEEYPWRYESVWLASLFRVGFIGAFIYVLPFILYIRAFWINSRRKNTNTFDLFMFAGFVSSFAATNTNPYIESVAFQWMYVMPLVSMALKSRSEKFARLQGEH